MPLIELNITKVGLIIGLKYVKLRSPKYLLHLSTKLILLLGLYFDMRLYAAFAAFWELNLSKNHGRLFLYYENMKISEYVQIINIGLMYRKYDQVMSKFTDNI